MSLLKSCVFIILITITFKTSAQTTDSLLKNKQLKVNAKVFGLSLSYEKRIGKKLTLNTEVGLRSGTGLYLSRYTFSEGLQALGAEATLEGRYYYHFKERLDKKKDIGNNSSNFWSIATTYAFKPFIAPSITHKYYYQYNNVLFITDKEKYSVISITPSWGIQRKVGNKFSLETLLGLSLNYFDVTKEFMLSPGITVRFGYVIL